MLFTAVTFYKVVVHNELANTELFTALRGNKGLVFCEPVVTTFLSTDQYVTLLYVFLFKDISFNK